MRRLEECWVSRASAQQRSGRAGRVRPGQCYRLFPRRLFEVAMDAHTLPELLRVPLEEPCLQIMANGAQGAPTTFLAEALDPPSHAAVVSALERLREAGALDLEDGVVNRGQQRRAAAAALAAVTDPNGWDNVEGSERDSAERAPRAQGAQELGEEEEGGREEDEEDGWTWCSANMRVRLRPLGRQLAQLPLDVKIGRMLVFGAIFGCIDPVATIAAALSLSQRSPFVSPVGRRAQADAARRAFCERSGGSDALAIARAYAEWRIEEEYGGRRASKQFCERFFLSSERLHTIRRTKRDLLKLLANIGFAKHTRGGAGADGGERTGGVDVASRWALDSPRAANANAARPEVVKAVLVAGLWPQAARCCWATDQRRNVPVMLVHGASKRTAFHLHPSSVATHWLKAARTPGGGGDAATGASATSTGKGKGKGKGAMGASAAPASMRLPAWGRQANAQTNTRDQWVVYLEKMRTTKVYLRDVTPVSPAAIMLFGGAIGVAHASHRASVDEWVEFRAYPRTAVLFRRLREALDELLLRKIEEPSLDFAASPVAKAAVALLTGAS